jgi:hypothetical protein
MYKRPDFLDCPNRGEERRRIEISMSICLTWFPFGWFRITQYIPELGLFYKNVGILLGVCPTCEELSGGYSQEMM